MTGRLKEMQVSIMLNGPDTWKHNIASSNWINAIFYCCLIIVVPLSYNANRLLVRDRRYATADDNNRLAVAVSSLLDLLNGLDDVSFWFFYANTDSSS
jgi:hypothetical protein